MSQQLDLLNLIANVVGIGGIVAIVFMLYQLYRLNKRLEMVLAPKTGIEGFLNMCAQVVEADPDGTCVVNSDGEIVLVNEAMEDASGYHRSEMVGQKVEMLVPVDLREVHAQRHRPGFMLKSSSRPMKGLALRHKRGFDRAADIYLGYYRDSSGEYAIAKVRIPE